MSDTATEAPIYKQTTFSNVVKDLEQFESTQTAIPQEPPTETPASVNGNGELQTPDSTPTETPVVEQPVVEENVSEFNVGDLGATPETPATPEAAQPTFNFDEELSKKDRKEVLKKLGVNDFALEIDEYLAKGGKAVDYLSAKAVDYNSFTDEQIVKEDLKKQYPTFTPQQIDLMFNRKYLVTEIMEEDEKEFVQLQLKADAYNSRQAKISEQQKFKIPDTPILQKDAEYEQWKQAQESQPALIKQLNEFYQNHEATKSLNESKRVAVNLGDGVPSFNFSVNNPQALTNVFTDGGVTAQRLLNNDKGEPDVAKQHLVSLFMYNPLKYSQDIFNYGVQMGKKKLMDEGQNAQRPQQKPMPQELNSTTYGVGKFSDKARS